MEPLSAPSRCPWCLSDPLYIQYHDREWGIPVHDDRVHFEFLVLESAQAGLNWLMILRKREGYKKAFADFDPERVALFNQTNVVELLGNAGIVRNRLKIEAAIRNAGKFLEIQSAFGSFDNYIWNFVDGAPQINRWKERSQLPATTELSEKVSRDLKKRGFSFLGPTVVYSHLQATGIVNDHLVSCFRHPDNHLPASRSSEGEL